MNKKFDGVIEWPKQTMTWSRRMTIYKNDGGIEEAGGGHCKKEEVVLIGATAHHGASWRVVVRCHHREQGE